MSEQLSIEIYNTLALLKKHDGNKSVMKFLNGKLYLCILFSPTLIAERM